MTIGKPSFSQFGRSLTQPSNIGPSPLSGGPSGRKRRTSRRGTKRAALGKRLQTRRSLQSQPLEARQLLAGPELVGITSNSGQLILNSTSLDNVPSQGIENLNISPRELTFQFDDSVDIDPDTLGDAENPLAITITRKGDDGSFESARATTDFNTNADAFANDTSIPAPFREPVLIEFRAAPDFPGVNGNGIRVLLTSTSRTISQPVDIRTPTAAELNFLNDIEPVGDKPVVVISLNSNPTRPATMRDLGIAIRDLNLGGTDPLANIIQSFEVYGETLTPVGTAVAASGPIALTLDGANAASATTDFGLGEGTSVRFIANQSGAAGRDISVSIVRRDLGAQAEPLVTVTGTNITVTVNSNATNPATVGDIVDAINDTPTSASLITARLDRGDASDEISGAFGGTFNLDGATDTVVEAGFVGIGDSPNEVVFRFAEALPDDEYQIQVFGEGVRALLNQDEEAFNDGVDFATRFNLNTPPRVAAVVPQPVTRNVSGQLIPDPTGIEVHFTQDVDPDSVLDPRFYELIYTNDTATTLDDAVFSPTASSTTPAVQVVDGRPNVVRLNFADALNRLGEGSIRLRIGEDSMFPSAAPMEESVVTDAGDSFGTARVITNLQSAAPGETVSVRLTGGQINNPSVFELQYPGGTDYPGVRNLRPDDPSRLDRTVPLDVWRGTADSFAGITTAFYNFPSEYQTIEGGDQTFTNLIADLPEQQQRVREVMSLFSEYLGIQFVEIGDTASGAISVPAADQGPLFSIGVGDLNAVGDISAAGGVTLDTTSVANLSSFDPDNPTAPLDPVANQALLVMDFQDFDESVDDQIGGEFFRGAFFGVGQLLGYGYADHLPQPVTQSTDSVLDDAPFVSVFDEQVALGVPPQSLDPALRQVPAQSSDLSGAPEALFPSPSDIVNGQYLYRPESNDIDLYQFTLSEPGTLSLSTVAERLERSSSLDTALRLYQQLDDGSFIEIAANDDYFSNDSLIEIDVTAGTYAVGVSSTGNTTYDPIIAGTGLGGVSQGDYELVMTFESQASDGIQDVQFAGITNALDGDADGEAGGDFNFWFRANDPNTIVYVDSTGGGGLGGRVGSITNPFREIDVALNDPIDGILARQARGEIVETLRIVGGGDYQIGRTTSGNPLRDGVNLDVPQGINLIIDAGSTFQMSRSRIGVGSTTASEDRSGGSISIYGTPDESVQFVGLNATPGSWGGIDIRGDVDLADDSRTNFENAGVFLNHIQYADIQNGGGEVTVDGLSREISPIELADVRATVMNNRITNSANAAISATPNTFAETRFDEARFQNELVASDPASGPFVSDIVRVGPHINGNFIADNSINGLNIRLETPPAGDPERLQVSARFDDTDIVHVLTENLLIEGDAGGVSAGRVIPSAVLVDGTAIANVVGASAANSGQIPAGTYIYRITFVDRNGFETAPSDATGQFTLGVTGRVALTSLPVVPSADFTGRRLYRAETSDTDAMGNPIFREVARLNGTDTDFIDGVLAGTKILDPAVIADPTAARAGRVDASLVIDPGTVVKLQGSRIDVTFDSHLYAEGTLANPVVITSLNDNRYGAGGTFDTGGGLNSEVQPGDWGGIYLGFGADGSFDNAVLAGGGGTTRIDGGFASFNVLEAHQSDLRVNNSRFEMNADGRGFLNDNANNINNPDDVREARVGRANNASGTVFVRGSQPIITGNDFIDGSGPVMSFDVNSFSWNERLDYGRSTGRIDASTVQGNSGPLISDNRIDVNGTSTGAPTDTTNQAPRDAAGNLIPFALNGLEIRGGQVATEVVWDDTDIVHIVRDMIEVPNQHIYGGLRLESDARGSLVVKFQSPDADNGELENDLLRQRQAGIVVGGNLISAANQFIDIDDRIGGSLQIVGQPDFPVVLTALLDDTVGAGFTPDGRANLDTDNNGISLDENGDPIFIPVSTADPSPTPSGLPLGPEFDRTDRIEVDNGPLIDNDIDPNNVGFFSADILAGGEVIDVTVSGQDQVTEQPLLQQAYQSLYTTFIDVDLIFPDSSPDAVPLSQAFEGEFAPVPQLISPDRVRTSAVYQIPGANRSIRWTVESFFLDNRAVLYSTVDLETVDGLPFNSGFVSSIDILSYLDSGVEDDAADVLYQLGTPGDTDFRLMTLSQTARVGFSHGGIYENDPVNQFNASYNGWAIDDPDTLTDAIIANGIGPQLAGDIPDNFTAVPVAVAPTFAGVTGGTQALGVLGAPADIASAHEWRLDGGSDSARVTHFIEWIASDPADPFDVVLPSPIEGSGAWDGITVREAASDFNVAVSAESEPGNIGVGPINDLNATTDTAQFLGELAPSVEFGDDNLRVGLIVDGELSQQGDDDVYSFIAEGGTQVWMDIDRTNGRLDTVLELVDANGNTLVLSDNSIAEAEQIDLLQTGTTAQQNAARTAIQARIGGGGTAIGLDNVLGLGTTIADATLGQAQYQDQYSVNSKDAGMRVILPGTLGVRTLYHVRVRSVPQPVTGGPTLINSVGQGVTTGAYQLQVRLTENDVFPGTQIRFSDVRYAVNGVQIINGPLHSPLTGDAYEVSRDNDTLLGAQRLGLYNNQYDPFDDSGDASNPFGPNVDLDAINDFLNDNDDPADPITVADLVAAFPTVFSSSEGLVINRDSQGFLRVDIDLANQSGPLA
ncbi:MAG: cyclic nucleotide-binding protein, partial [Planctomycetota bacterium]